MVLLSSEDLFSVISHRGFDLTEFVRHFGIDESLADDEPNTQAPEEANHEWRDRQQPVPTR